MVLYYLFASLVKILNFENLFRIVKIRFSYCLEELVHGIKQQSLNKIYELEYSDY